DRPAGRGAQRTRPTRGGAAVRRPGRGVDLGPDRRSARCAYRPSRAAAARAGPRPARRAIVRVVPLLEADPACGRKAHAPATHMRAGLPVPDGFVVTDPAPDLACDLASGLASGRAEEPRRISAPLRRLRARA